MSLDVKDSPMEEKIFQYRSFNWPKSHKTKKTIRIHQYFVDMGVPYDHAYRGNIKL